jgi:DNA polymerase-1
MIKFDNGIMVQSVNELPKPENIHNLYLDFETTSGDDDKDSLNPWKNCSILGYNFTFDAHETAYYVPMRHRDSLYNIDIDISFEYLKILIENTKYRIIGHNIKYDIHVLLNSLDINLRDLELCDTVTLAKIINSDRLTYNMTDLSKDFLYEDISPYEKDIKVYTHTKGGSIKYHDYAIIPADKMAPYACQDALTTRKLYKYCVEHCHSDCVDTWCAEVQLTGRLIEIECNGVTIDIYKVMKDGIKRIPRLLNNITKALEKLTGQIFRPHTNEDCYQILCVKYDLPIVEWTEKEEPSFGKAALKAYMTFPNSPKRVISLISKYRKWFKIKTGFLDVYMLLCKNNGSNVIKLHTNYNQCVRTGRMASSKPNTQQVPMSVKKYIIPDKNCILIDFDLKQIEYRCIADLIEDQAIIKEYQNNPEADYHDIMAKRCQIDRKSAKNMNFAVSFGAGKAKTIKMLKSAFDASQIPDGISFDTYCEIKGLEIYKEYHRQVPNLKKTIDEASNALMKRGYIKNRFGRHRNLPRQFHYKAFNTAVQSWAADIMKRITLRLCDLLDDQHLNLKIVAIVHDSWLISCPKELAEEWIPRIKNCIEKTETKMCVPMYANYSISDKNWGECK